MRFHEKKVTIDKYVNKLLETIRYLKYIKDERVKIQHFLSGLPHPYKDIIEIDEFFLQTTTPLKFYEIKGAPIKFC
jgi:hypothetical protein